MKNNLSGMVLWLGDECDWKEEKLINGRYSLLNCPTGVTDGSNTSVCSVRVSSVFSQALNRSRACDYEELGINLSLTLILIWSVARSFRSLWNARTLHTLHVHSLYVVCHLPALNFKGTWLRVDRVQSFLFFFFSVSWQGFGYLIILSRGRGLR